MGNFAELQFGRERYVVLGRRTLALPARLIHVATEVVRVEMLQPGEQVHDVDAVLDVVERPRADARDVEPHDALARLGRGRVRGEAREAHAVEVDDLQAREGVHDRAERVQVERRLPEHVVRGRHAAQAEALHVRRVRLAALGLEEAAERGQAVVVPVGLDDRERAEEVVAARLDPAARDESALGQLGLVRLEIVHYHADELVWEHRAHDLANNRQIPSPRAARNPTHRHAAQCAEERR